MKSQQDYRNFLENHAELVKEPPKCPWVPNVTPSFWRVTEPIKAFKKVLSYSARRAPEVPFYLHASEVSLKEKLLGPRLNLIDLYSSLWSDAIVNLEIPKGALLYWNGEESRARCDYGKLRANKADVHSIVRIHDKKQVLFGISSKDRSFMYLNSQLIGKKTTVQPTLTFSMQYDTCSSGIHFFVELDAAKNYQL